MIETVFRAKYKEHMKIAYRALKDHHHAQDAVQEAYLRAVKYQNSYREGMDAEAWMYGILRNAIKTVQTDVRNGGIVMEAKARDFPVELFDPDKLRKFDLLSEIEEYTGDDDAKEKLRLHFKLGYAPVEVAEFCGCSIVSVYSVVSRFKRQMKEKYTKG